MGIDGVRLKRRDNEGRSGGFRAIVVFRSGETAFFVYGFPKSSRGNVREVELQGFRQLAGEMLSYDDAALAKALEGGALQEVQADAQELSK